MNFALSACYNRCRIVPKSTGIGQQENLAEFIQNVVWPEYRRHEIIENFVEIIENFVEFIQSFVEFIQNDIEIIQDFYEIIENYIEFIQNLVEIKPGLTFFTTKATKEHEGFLYELNETTKLTKF